ncbi:GTP-binding protein [Abeliophyllum distichum]|uniref:GTP-binding protein n=1 Tax=Abeliophyllum distichum TaxID=126358 RepID=A0ABD1RAX1_9LAMI
MLRAISRWRSSVTPKSLQIQINHSLIPHPSSYFFSNSPVLHRGHRKDSDFNNGDDELNRDPDGPLRIFVVQPRLRPDSLLKPKLHEALNLANSLDEQRDGFYDTEFLAKEMPPHLVVQNPTARSPRADTFFGGGTVSNVKCHVNALESKDEVDAIFVNTVLTGIQQRNLERAWGKPVLDRVGLIIEIFNAHAQTKEAKLQAELAALMYKRSRLVRVRGPDGRYTFGGIGEAEVVSARGRGSGGRGFISGAGETELQLQRRRILNRRKQLLAEIKEVRRTRALQRAARKRQKDSQGKEIATVAVVGYTNAGKSTLVSALSNSYLYCDDRLFATVDPKLSSVILPSGRKVLLSDTVGFISDLPVQLVEAFHATLEEVVEADLLVHVLDSSASNLDEHRETVLQVLGKIGVSEEKLQNMIEVWNKVDLQEDKFNEGKPEGEDYISSSSGGEDNDIAFDQLSGKDADVHDNNEDEKAGLLGDLEEVIHDHQGDYSDGWLSTGDEENTWVDYDSCSVGCKTTDAQLKEVSRDWTAAVKGSRSKQEYTHCVKTSAVTKVGLQELLEVIDEKLWPGQVVERDFFNRKWRPSHTEDDKIAVEQ